MPTTAQPDDENRESRRAARAAVRDYMLELAQGGNPDRERLRRTLTPEAAEEFDALLDSVEWMRARLSRRNRK